MTLYPNGYGTQYVTLDEMKSLHGVRMHPEFARRFFAYMEHKGGLLGVGGGYRAGGTQPEGPTFAPEGKSFHQNQTFASGIVAYSAVDLVVGVPGNVHRAPYWSETEDAPLYGLHTFIKNPEEPWHIQCIEMRGWQSWYDAGRPDPGYFQLPNDFEPGDMMGKPVVTTWTGEQWPILVSYNAATGQYVWRGIDGPEVDTLVFVGAAEDRRSTPWPSAWKTMPWVKRVG